MPATVDGQRRSPSSWARFLVVSSPSEDLRLYAKHLLFQARPGLVYVTARRASLEADTPWSFRPRPWTCSSAPKTWSVKPNTKQVLDRIAWLCCQRAR